MERLAAGSGTFRGLASRAEGFIFASRDFRGGKAMAIDLFAEETHAS